MRLSDSHYSLFVPLEPSRNLLEADFLGRIKEDFRFLEKNECFFLCPYRPKGVNEYFPPSELKDMKTPLQC